MLRVLIEFSEKEIMANGLMLRAVQLQVRELPPEVRSSESESPPTDLEERFAKDVLEGIKKSVVGMKEGIGIVLPGPIADCNCPKCTAVRAAKEGLN